MSFPKCLDLTEMQKMYEQMAESKGALTEEEQARYNLGTAVNTDDELDE